MGWICEQKMAGDLSIGCGSSVGRCCCKLCRLLHISCASTVGTADLWSDLFCLFFPVPVVSSGVTGLGRGWAAVRGAWHWLFSRWLSKLIWFNTFLNHDGSVTISQIHTGGRSGKYCPSGEKAGCFTASWRPWSAVYLELGWGAMAWHVRVTCNCLLPVSHGKAPWRGQGEAQDSSTGFCSWEEGSQDGSQFNRCRGKLGGCSEK